MSNAELPNRNQPLHCRVRSAVDERNSRRRIQYYTQQYWKYHAEVGNQKKLNANSRHTDISIWGLLLLLLLVWSWYYCCEAQFSFISPSNVLLADFQEGHIKALKCFSGDLHKWNANPVFIKVAYISYRHCITSISSKSNHIPKSKSILFICSWINLSAENNGEPFRLQL